MPADKASPFTAETLLVGLVGLELPRSKVFSISTEVLRSRFSSLPYNIPLSLKSLFYALL